MFVWPVFVLVLKKLLNFSNAIMLWSPTGFHVSTLEKLTFITLDHNGGSL